MDLTYVIGIDGGGTKTEAVLADQLGNVLEVAKAGPTNINTTSEQDVEEAFSILFQLLKDKHPQEFNHVSTVFAGISGAGGKYTQQTIKQFITKRLSETVTTYVEPDTINALYSGTYGEAGIVQISGTGSITYGINEAGVHERVGGWGYLLGDEGSGYDIGRNGIIAALHAADGRGKETLLLNLVFNHFRVNSARHLIEKIYQAPVPKNEISPVAKLVFQAFYKNDPIAHKIILKAANDITISILTLANKLFEKKSSVQVVLCGGVFYDENVLPAIIKEQIASKTDKLTLHLPRISPVGGSVIGALKFEHQSILSNKIINNLKQSLKVGDGSCRI